jgi:undecaprenyl-diphosphatase
MSERTLKQIEIWANSAILHLMEIIKVIILGIVEGLTEFLPISSTGHVIVAEKLLHFRDEAALFTVVVQIGAILAAALFFRKDLLHIVKRLIAGDKSMQKFTLSVLIGIIPAGIIGIAIEKFAKISDSLVAISASMIIGGIVLLLVENYANITPSKTTDIDYDSVTPRRSLYVGIAQCFALIPGVSRSGATIVGGMLSGLDRRTAAVFSFYLGIPIMIAASGLKLAKHHSELSSLPGGSFGLLIGVAASFISAFLVVKWLLKYIQTHDFRHFAYYRIVAGTILLASALTKVI